MLALAVVSRRGGMKGLGRANRRIEEKAGINYPLVQYYLPLRKRRHLLGFAHHWQRCLMVALLLSLAY